MMKKNILRFQIEKMISFNKKEKEEKECSICYTHLNMNNILETHCKHIYCVNCFIQYIQTKPLTDLKIQCPFCRQIIQKVIVNDVENGISDVQSVVINTRRLDFMEPDPVRNYGVYDNSLYSDHLQQEYTSDINHIIFTFILYSIANIVLVLSSIGIILFYIMVFMLLIKTSIHLFLP